MKIYNIVVDRRRGRRKKNVLGLGKYTKGLFFFKWLDFELTERTGRFLFYTTSRLGNKGKKLLLIVVDLTASIEWP